MSIATRHVRVFGKTMEPDYEHPGLIRQTQRCDACLVPWPCDAGRLMDVLLTCGLAAHVGGELYDSHRRGAREKLAYIEDQVARLLPEIGA